MEKDVVKKRVICSTVSILWTIAVSSYISTSDIVVMGGLILFFAFLVLSMQDNLYFRILSPNKKDIVIAVFFSLLLLVGKLIYIEHYLTSLFGHPFYNLVIFIGTAHFLAVFIPYIVETLYSFFSESLPEIELGKKHLIAFIVIVSALDIIAFLTYYPGVAAYDYGPSYCQATGESPLNNQQPILYTLIWKAIFLVAGNFHDRFMGNVIYSLVQIIVVNITFCYVLIWLKKKKVSSMLILFSGLYYMINPTFWLYSFETTKDVYFGCILIVFLTSFYDLITTKKRVFTCFISCLLACFLRNNMIYAMIVLCIVVFFIVPSKVKKLELASVLPALLISILVPAFLYPAMKIEYTDSAEFLSIPIQQISALYAHDGYFNEEEKEILKQYLPRIEDYNYRFADPVKNYMDNDLYDKDKAPFWKIYFKGLKCNPHIYLSAALDTNVQLWYPASTANDQFAQRDYVEIELYPSDEAVGHYTHGIFDRIRPYLKATATLHNTVSTLPLVRNYLSLSFPFFSLAFCLIIMIRMGKKYETVIPIALLLLEATYMLGPVSNYRYLYPMYIMLPVYFSMTVRKAADTDIVEGSMSTGD